MSNFLSQVTAGQTDNGQRIIIAGAEKVGKTTLASNAPKALLVPMEVGFAGIVTPRTPQITTYDDLFALLDEIRLACQQGTFPFKTLSFDSATALEKLIHDKVLAEEPNKNVKNNTMETCHGGYGKGYALANGYFQRFTNYCDEFTKYAKLNIVITCHVFPTLVKDAAYGEYNSWDLLLHSPKNDKTFGKREMITQWADMVGYLHDPLVVLKEEKGQSLKRGLSTNQGRMLAVDRTPGWVAGNRYGLTGLIPIPPVNGWNAIAHAIYESRGIDIWNRDV